MSYAVLARLARVVPGALVGALQADRKTGRETERKIGRRKETL
jgi:hypothetical protein